MPAMSRFSWALQNTKSNSTFAQFLSAKTDWLVDSVFVKLFQNKAYCDRLPIGSDAVGFIGLGKLKTGVGYYSFLK